MKLGAALVPAAYRPLTVMAPTLVIVAAVVAVPLTLIPKPVMRPVAAMVAPVVDVAVMLTLPLVAVIGLANVMPAPVVVLAFRVMLPMGAVKLSVAAASLMPIPPVPETAFRVMALLPCSSAPEVNAPLTVMAVPALALALVVVPPLVLSTKMEPDTVVAPMLRLEPLDCWT